MGVITRPAYALLIHRLRNAGFGRGLDGGGMKTSGLLGELRISSRVFASAGTGVRVEVGGGVSLLVDKVEHTVKNAADSVHNWPKSVQV